ncbi:MAG TPA: hypothetical protein VII28_05830 [Puia sp.]
MQPTNYKKAGLLALILTIISLASWEYSLRNKGVYADYDDNDALWANKRAMVYEPKDKATVFIGSSRIKYDLDIPTWESLTGNHAVQLANVGSSPRPVMEDLANDPNFKGRLVVDVTEGLFFFPGLAFYDGSTNKKIRYYHDITPTERFSFQVDRVLESQFVFLDQDNYSINAMLDQMKIPNRTGAPFFDFPMEFGRNTYARQAYMTPEFVADTNLQNRVKAVWMGCARMGGPPPVSGKALDSILNWVKIQVDKIKSHGGDVIFVRTPSSGPAFMGEQRGFPRKDYWDRILSTTGCPGIYFQDYPAIASFICPEWSHLKPADGVIYTKNLVKILEDEKGWTFLKNSSNL